MKIQLFFLLLSFLASDSFSQKNKSNQDFTNVYHYRNYISLKHFDGTQATISVNGNSATLFNADGSQSTIDFGRNTSTLIAIDGTGLSVFHNGLSSTVFLSDGTRVIVNHMNSTSSCLTEDGKHTITHTFGNTREMRHKNQIDVLIHMNWLIQKDFEEASEEFSKEELQN